MKSILGWTRIKQRVRWRRWCHRQGGHGIHPGDKGSNHSGVFWGLRVTLWVTFEEGTWSVWLYGLLNAVSINWWCAIRGRTRCSRWEQERPQQCSQTGRAVTRQSAAAGLSRRTLRAHAAGTIAELSNHRQRSIPGHASSESGVSQLGDSLCGKRCLLSSPSNAEAGQDPGSRGAASSRATYEHRHGGLSVLRRSGSRVTMPIACSRHGGCGAPSLRVTLCPLG
jgi:hypothetical protein